MEFLGLLILLPIYTWFLLFELERIHRFIARYLPSKDREHIVRIGSQIGEMLANFFRGRLLVCVGKGAFIAVGLWIAGVDYALLLGFGTGFLSLIPFVGTGIGLIVGLFVGMFDHELLSALIRVGIVFAAAEAFENYVLLPRILGESLGLHPVVVIFALMAGAASLGMFGLLIALPLTASIVILSRELLLPVLAEMADKGAGTSGKGTTPPAP
jgi:predicted PurR-regulated permease PerM